MLLAKRIEDLERSRGNAADLIAFTSWDLEEDALACVEFDGKSYVQEQGQSRNDWLQGISREIAPKVKRQTYLWMESLTLT